MLISQMDRTQFVRLVTWISAAVALNALWHLGMDSGLSVRARLLNFFVRLVVGLAIAIPLLRIGGGKLWDHWHRRGD